MRVLGERRLRANAPERGVALLISFLVLLVVIALVYQIHIVTSTDGKVAHNDITRTRMDLAIESALLEVYEMLADDGEAAAAEEGGGSAGGLDPVGGGTPASGGVGGVGGEGGEGGEGGSAVDSKMDDWARPQATSINEVELRILIQDEDSKYNILNMLNPDEEVAEKAFERVARILDRFREDTREDVGGSEAEEMARVMREHLQRRSDSAVLPRPVLLTDVGAEDDNLGMPVSLREFAVLEPFEEIHFRDYFDSDGVRVHSIESFLTIWTSARTGPVVAAGQGGGGGAGADPGGAGGSAGNTPAVPGFAVNINTAPLAVLASLTDSRDVNYRFWDGVLEYRNTEAEAEEGEEEIEPLLDENGEEIIQRQFFENFDVLDDIYGWINLEPAMKEEIQDLLVLESHVFSIYVTARLATQEEDRRIEAFDSREERERYERSGLNLMRTVRSVVWRNSDAAEMGVIPLLRWEVLDYQPLEVLDYADEDR